MFRDVGFEIMIASAPEYEKVFAEIYSDGKFVVAVTQEAGPEQCRLEFPGATLDESLITRNVDAQGLMNAIQRASKKLRGQK